MSGIILNKVAAPSNPTANKIEIYYDSGAPGIGTNNKLVAIDESGNKVTLGGFAVKDYRLIRIVTLLTTGGATYTPTAGAQALYIECIGPGGAGGGAATSSSTCSCGGGGGAGAYSALWLTGTLKTSYAYNVALGGAAGAAGAAGSASATLTTFDSPSICTADKGLGGAVLAAGSTLVTQAGAAGGLASNGVGDLKFDGCDGGWGIRLSASVAKGGDGGAAPLGGGEIKGAAATLTAGTLGKLYGGGGSGAMTATTAQAGGAGAQGVIRIWEFS